MVFDNDPIFFSVIASYSSVCTVCNLMNKTYHLQCNSLFFSTIQHKIIGAYYMVGKTTEPLGIDS